jgi:hypothetical protein
VGWDATALASTGRYPPETKSEWKPGLEQLAHEVRIAVDRPNVRIVMGPTCVETPLGLRVAVAGLGVSVGF